MPCADIGVISNIYVKLKKIIIGIKDQREREKETDQVEIISPTRCFEGKKHGNSFVVYESPGHPSILGFSLTSPRSSFMIVNMFAR